MSRPLKAGGINQRGNPARCTRCNTPLTLPYYRIIEVGEKLKGTYSFSLQTIEKLCEKCYKTPQKPS